MFGLVRGLIDQAVEKAGVAAKVTVEITTGLSTAIVAEPLKKAMGENPVSEKLWELRGKVSDRMCHLIDEATPVTKAIAKVPVRKAERLCELGHGVGQVLFTEQKREGYRKIENALTEMAATLITGGIVGAALEYCTDAADVIAEIPEGTDGEAILPSPTLKSS